MHDIEGSSGTIPFYVHVITPTKVSNVLVSGIDDILELYSDRLFKNYIFLDSFHENRAKQ
jgi:hypothetical protein